MRYKNDKKYQICHHQIRFIKLKMHQNPFSAGRAYDGGAYDAPPDPLVAPFPSPRRRLELGASVLRPPSTQNPGYASGSTDILYRKYGRSRPIAGINSIYNL